MENIHRAASRFLLEDVDFTVQEHGSGKVNDTFLVAGPDVIAPFILQRISAVFPHPEHIMENMRAVFDHAQDMLSREKSLGRYIAIPALCRTRSGRDFYRDSKGSFWRALYYIDHTKCFDEVQSVFQAREAGFALGNFHRLIHDLDPSNLHDTLPGFHVTPIYLAHYDKVAAAGAEQSMTADMRFCHDFISERREMSSVLENAVKQGLLVLRPVHGDPKLSNILFDERSGRAAAIIDLDTVKPGLVQTDIGDCLRSCCNRVGEESVDKKAHFDTELYRAILQGYLSEVGRFLTPADYDFIYPALRLIAFELGLRFYTDFLEGNVYFKTERLDQNLERALVQFRLAESIEKQQNDIEQVIKEVRFTAKPV